MNILKSPRGQVTLILTLAALAFAILPWQSRVRAPAIMRPALQTEIFPQAPARLMSLRVKNGQNVVKGDVIAVLRSEYLEQETYLTQHALALTRARLARRGSDAVDLSSSSVLLQAQNRDLAKLTGLEAARQDLVVRAPHTGIVSDLSSDLHVGRYVPISERLVRISAPGKTEIIAFAKEHDAGRLSEAAHMIFIPDDLLSAKISAQITGLAPVAEPALKEDILSGQFKGPIAVTQDDDANAIPTTAVFRVNALTSDIQSELRAVRGIAIMTAKRQSPAGVFFRRVGQVLIRETDF